MLWRASNLPSYILRHCCRSLSSSTVNSAAAREATVSKRWWDSEEDFDKIQAGIQEHFEKHASPIASSAIHKLFQVASRPEDVAIAIKLMERQHVQKAHHEQHKPFAQDLSTDALKISLERGNPQLAAHLLMNRYRLGLSVLTTEQWQEVIKASYELGNLEVPHKLWRAMPKNKVAVSTLELLVDGSLAANRPDLAKGYTMEWQLNGLTVPQELQGKVDAASAPAADSGEEPAEAAAQEETSSDAATGSQEEASSKKPAS